MTCAVDGCERRIYAKAFCESHYKRNRVYGNPQPERRLKARKGEPQKFLNNLLIETQPDDCVFWPYAKGKGYARIDGKDVSRLVCEKVNGPPEKASLHAAHSCGKGNLGCVNPKHLRWATVKENMDDRNTHGTSNRGSRHGMSKLNEAQVLEIRNLLLSGTMQQKEIAKIFEVSKTTICNINKNRIWIYDQD